MHTNVPPGSRAGFLAVAAAGALALGCRAAEPTPSRPAPFDATPRVSTASDAPPPRTEPVPGGTLEELLGYAVRHSPRIEAAFQRWVAAAERVPQVDSLPDPRLSLRWYAREVETRVGPQEWAVGIGQTIPLGGQPGLRGDVALERAAAAWERHVAVGLAVLQEVKDAWYEATYLGRAIEIVHRNREIVANLVEVAQSRYRSGQTQYADVIRAQIELGILDDRHRSLTDLKAPLRARLAAALDLPPGVELPWPSGAATEDDAPPVAEDVVHEWIAEANPELRALEHEIRSGEHAIELAERDSYPDLTVGLDWIATGDAAAPGVAGSGEDPLIVGVSMNVPLQRGRYRAGEREARAHRRDAASRLEDKRNTLRSEAELLLYRLRDARRKTELYRDTLVPRARQTLEATEAAYRAGSADFLDLVDAETVLLEFELALERARADLGQSRAALERLVARPLDAAEAEVER